MSNSGKTNRSQKRQKKKQSGKLTEVYFATAVPPMAPDFVDSHFTEDEGGFLFEVDPTHPTVMQARENGKTVIELLNSAYFKSVMHIYSGERPDFPCMG